jgi:hypothetical protein
MRTVSILLILLCGAAGALAKDKPPLVHRIPLPARPDFSELDWLAGEWEGKTADKGPAGDVRLSVSLDLDKRYLIFRGEEKLAATAELPEYKESWLGIMTQEPKSEGFILRIFSDSGFITRYRASVVAGTVTLNQEGGEQPPPGWLFRRIVQRTDIGELLVTVQAAPPQKPFFDYFSAILKHKTPQ